MSVSNLHPYVCGIRNSRNLEIWEGGALEHGNLGIWSMEYGNLENGILNTCASATRSLGDNLTHSINMENKAL